jgi:hypothetical protein
VTKNPGLGPGAYKANYNVTKKSIPAIDWASSKVPRALGGPDATSKDPASPKKSTALPGPGSYEVGAAGKIGGSI